MKKEKTGIRILLVLALIAVVSMFFMDPIVQDDQYHHFVDAKTIFGVPNFWNVISNLPFMIVGIIGLSNYSVFGKVKIPYVFLFLGILLISFGSGYYHLYPDSQSLVWDRLPMTIVFMALFSIIVSEFISESLGRFLLIPLILIGLGAIGLWVYGTTGDLRLYALVQFYPMIAIPIILIFFRSRYTKSKAYWMLLIAYVFAKLFEYYDKEIYEISGLISGHSLKHVIAAMGLYVLFDAYKKRSLILGCQKKP